MPELDLSHFHQLCGISVIIDEDGKNPVLCASCTVRDSDGELHELKRSIALEPIMEMIADKIRTIHDKLHAEMNVSGPFDKLFSKSRGHKRAVGKYASRHALPEIMKKKVWAGLEDEGEDESRDRDFLDAPENLDLLPPGQDPLQVQGWFDSIKHIASRVGEIKIVKSLYSDIQQAGRYAQKGAEWAKSHKDLLKKIAANSGIPGAEGAIDMGFKVYDVVKAAKNDHPEAINALKKIKALADAGDEKAQQAILAAKNMNDMLNAKDNADRLQAYTQVSGWLYNSPYRTNLQTLADAATGKFPTMSMAIREGWHDGLAFAGSMQRKKWSPFA